MPEATTKRRGRPRKTQPAAPTAKSLPDETTTPAVEAADETVTESPVPTPKGDPVRLELMKRIYVARDPESTADTWLHAPGCDPKDPNHPENGCAAQGCRAFSGLEVGERINAGWWNDVLGDH